MTNFNHALYRIVYPLHIRRFVFNDDSSPRVCGLELSTRLTKCSLIPKDLSDMRLTVFARQKKSSRSSGFALVLALSMMAFVLMLVLSLTTLVQVESQTSSISTAKVEAEQAALLALQVALGEVQNAAGPDQRVTATADILIDGTSPDELKRRRWLGVWDTTDYDPADPNTKTFNRWLVSSNEPAGFFADTNANDAVLEDELIIFEAVDASGNRVEENDVVVDKIKVESASSVGEVRYAYWVEDEGVKADLSWNEGEFSESERGQTARLSSVRGWTTLCSPRMLRVPSMLR